MTRPLLDTEYLYGLHEAGGEHLFLDAGRTGWIVFNEAIGHDPKDTSGADFTRWSELGLGVICRLNHGFPPDGTLPHSSLYEEFARRAANFVAASSGCKIWVIGNEMNYAVERPGVQVDWSRHASTRGSTPEESDPQRRGLVTRFNVLPDFSTEIRTTRGATISPGEVITPEMYARCYRLCRDAIHRLPNHADDQVLVGAVAPWNSQTIYAGNANGDWIQYFRDILETLGPKDCDGFTLHTYSRGGDPALITSAEKLGAPFQAYHAEFRAYTDFMAAVPDNMRTLPVYLTEIDQTSPWLDVNNGWVQAAYAEIDAWNQQPANQQIRAVVLYRWPTLDRWHLAGKPGVLQDFQQAMIPGYRWRGSEAANGGGSRRHAPEDDARPSTPLVETPALESTEERPRDRESDKTERLREREASRQVKTAPYRAQWLDDRFPSRLNAGQIVTVPITVKNAGALTWTAEGDQPFRIGYRYYRNRRMLALGADKDLRTEAPQMVKPGDTATIPVRIALPDQPGNYTLEVDVVHEGVTWLKEQGSPVLTLLVDS